MGRKPRSEVAAEAVRLRDEGLSADQIAARIGRHPKYVGRLLRDPDGSVIDRREEQDRQALNDAIPCPLCGVRLHILTRHLRARHGIDRKQADALGYPTVSPHFLGVVDDLYLDRYGALPKRKPKRRPKPPLARCPRGHVRRGVRYYGKRRVIYCEKCSKERYSRRKKRPLMERFEEKFVRGGPDECWEWTGSRDPNGYGRIYDGRPGRGNVQGVSLAHRVAYELLGGKRLRKGKVIDHLCFNPSCVNPAHLEQVTAEENTRRAMARITHCPQGHPYDEENTRIVKGGFRQCRACDRERQRAKAALKLAA